MNLKQALFYAKGNDKLTLSKLDCYYFIDLLWKIIPLNMKELESINNSKGNIKKWKPEKCQCSIYKTFTFPLLVLFFNA